MSDDDFWGAVDGDRSTQTLSPRLVADPAAKRADTLHPYAKSAVDGELARLDALPHPWHEGANWDTTTFEVACNLIEIANSPWAGYDIEVAQGELHEHAPRDGEWNERQIEQKWRSATQRVAGGCRPEPTGGEAQPTPKVTVMGGGPRAALQSQYEAFWEADPVFTHIRDFARARVASPWAVLGCSLTRAVAAVPAHVVLPPLTGGVASLNLFVGLIGLSGAGKGAAEAAAADAINFGKQHFARPASGEAITHLYKHREAGNPDPQWNDEDHSWIVSISEIDRLTAQSSRQGSTFMSELRAAWSGEMLGQVAADKSRSIVLEPHEYRLCLQVGIQPGRAGGLLDDADGGTPQRFLWMPATDPEAPDVPPEEPSTHSWEKPYYRQLMANTKGQLLIKIDSAIVAEVREHRLAMVRGWKKTEDGQDEQPLNGHAMLSRLKVAAALAILRGNVIVSPLEWGWSETVMAKSDETRLAVVEHLAAERTRELKTGAERDAYRAALIEERVEEGALGRAKKAIVRCLIAGDEVSASVVRKRMNTTTRQHFEEAVADLLQKGLIEEMDAQNAGRKLRAKP